MNFSQIIIKSFMFCEDKEKTKNSFLKGNHYFQNSTFNSYYFNNTFTEKSLKDIFDYFLKYYSIDFEIETLDSRLFYKIHQYSKLLIEKYTAELSKTDFFKTEYQKYESIIKPSIIDSMTKKI